MDGWIDRWMDELTVKWIDGWMALDGLIDLETEEDGWCVFLLRKKVVYHVCSSGLQDKCMLKMPHYKIAPNTGIC